MLSLYVRVAQAIELSVYIGLVWLLHGRGWSLPVLVLLVAVAIPGVRLAVVLLSVLVASRQPSGEPALNASAKWRWLRREWGALLAFNLVYLPWERWVLRPDPSLAPEARVPILLVHGYFANRGCFRPLVRRLEAAGAGAVHVPNFRTWFASIESFEEEIHAAIERIVAMSGAPRVLVVAHSMGGLAMRAYLVRHGAARVARLVTIASPHHGTALAAFGMGQNARQMRRGSVFLSELARIEERREEVPTLSLYTPHDNLVAPARTSRLAWARNRAVPGYGHLSILGSDMVAGCVIDELRAAEAGLASAAAR